MTRFQELVTQNPMRAETRWLFRRFLRSGVVAKSHSNATIFVVAGIYAFVFFIFFESAGDIGSMWVLLFQQMVLVLLAAFGSYTSIAGEKENRTWDMLRIAPLSDGQIIFGKFISAGSLVTMGWLSFMPFVVTGAAMQRDPIEYFDAGQYVPPEWLARLAPSAFCSLVSLTSSLLFLAMTILISSRAKTAIGALCFVLGTGFVWLWAYPSFMNWAIGPDPRPIALSTLNPFVLIFSVLSSSVFSWRPFWDCLTVAGINSLLTVTLLTLARRSLRMEGAR